MIMKRLQGEKAADYIQTFVRVKPMSSDQPTVVSFSKHRVSVHGFNDTFEYNEVFGENEKNEAIFDTIMVPVVEHIFDGYNACILAYGQTSTGKTYTMRGSEYEMGLIPLTIREIHRRKNQNNLVARVSISYFQIYNQTIIDLLSSERHVCEIRDDARKNSIIQDLTQLDVQSEIQSLELYSEGEARRKTACNNINEYSSRSHTIFRIHLEVANVDLSTYSSCISLVDLAGSECIKATNAVGQLKKESQNINKSLLALTKVVRNLSQKNGYVNFRDSKLTRILQPCLTENSKTIVICTIQQNAGCASETNNTLKFGADANSIKVNVRKNVQNGFSPELDSRYEQLNEILKDSRAQNNIMNKRIIYLQKEVDRLSNLKNNGQIMIRELKHMLLLQQNQNINNNLLINQLRTEKDSQNQRTGTAINTFEDSIKLYKSQIARLESINEDMKKRYDHLKKQNEQLQNNQRTLLDKLAMYQKGINTLQSNVSQQVHSEKNFLTFSNANRSKNVKSEYLEKQGSIHQSIRNYDRQRSISENQTRYNVTQRRINPFSIGKIMQLSTRILDMKLQFQQYIQSNAQLQQENERLLRKVAELQLSGSSKIEQNTEDKGPRASAGSKRISGNGSKGVPASSVAKISQIQYKNLRDENRKLRNERVVLIKKLNQMRTSLKKNASLHIQELHGFNRFIERNFTEKEKEYFTFLFEEKVADFETIQIKKDEIVGEDLISKDLSQ